MEVIWRVCITSCEASAEVRVLIPKCVGTLLELQYMRGCHLALAAPSLRDGCIWKDTLTVKLGPMVVGHP